jgi:hypothetical protein
LGMEFNSRKAHDPSKHLPVVLSRNLGTHKYPKYPIGFERVHEWEN